MLSVETKKIDILQTIKKNFEKLFSKKFLATNYGTPESKKTNRGFSVLEFLRLTDSDVKRIESKEINRFVLVAIVEKVNFLNRL